MAKSPKKFRRFFCSLRWPKLPEICMENQMILLVYRGFLGAFSAGFFKSCYFASDSAASNFVAVQNRR